MATLNCPHRNQWITQLNSITFINKEVEIFNDICSHADKCGFTACEYFDRSKKADEKFYRGVARSHGNIEDQILEKEYELALRIKWAQSTGRK
jgi:hypothetical protein